MAQQAEGRPARFFGLGAAIGRDLELGERISVRLEILQSIPPLRVVRCSRTFQIRDSIVVSISARHAEDPGSIPGRGVVCIYHQIIVHFVCCNICLFFVSSFMCCSLSLFSMLVVFSISLSLALSLCLSHSVSFLFTSIDIKLQPFSPTKSQSCWDKQSLLIDYNCTPCGTRARNLRIRGPTPCPLGQGGNVSVVPIGGEGFGTHSGPLNRKHQYIFICFCFVCFRFSFF